MPWDINKHITIYNTDTYKHIDRETSHKKTHKIVGKYVMILHYCKMDFKCELWNRKEMKASKRHGYITHKQG